MRRARQPLMWYAIILSGIGAGLLYSWMISGYYTAGALYGFFVAVLIFAFERGVLGPRFRRWLRTLPAPVAIPLSELSYIVLVCVAFLFAGTISWTLQLTPDTYAAATIPSLRVLIYSLVVSAAVVFTLRVRDLLGAEVFASFLLGRYHRPVQEERIFLFLDVVGSTAFAEAHGDVRAQEFMAAFFEAIAEPIRRFHGTVDDYVGDMAMVTWPLARGIVEARCVCCVFAIEDELHRRAPEWLKRFGEVPRFRAALHAGPVVTAEVGVDRHKIAYFGDTVNVTARLESLCRPLGERFLVSADLLKRLPALPGTLAVEQLGTHPLRGRDQPVAVAALRRAGASATGVVRSMAAR